MRVKRAFLLLIVSALISAAAAQASPSSPLPTETGKDLRLAIFGPEQSVSPVESTELFYGVCSTTCDPCSVWEPCPPFGNLQQSCVYACY